MKKLLLSLVIFLSSSFMAFADNNALIVTMSDGTHHTFLLSSLPDVRMENDKMTITADSLTAQYDLYTVKTFTFGNVSTGIKSIETAQPSIHGNILIVPSADARVRVYAIDGSEVNARVSRGNGTVTVDLGSLPSGHIYIINADGKSVKILR